MVDAKRWRQRQELFVETIAICENINCVGGQCFSVALRSQYKTKAAGPPNLGSQALSTAAAAKSYMRATTMKSIGAGVVHTTIRVGAAKSLSHRLLWSNARKQLFQAYEGSGKVDYEHSVRNEFATWKDGRRGFRRPVCNCSFGCTRLHKRRCTRGQ